MPERGGDAAVAALGIHRIAIPIPFDAAGGPVNVVVVEEEGGGIALFDTGLAMPEAEEALAEGLASRGFRLEDVRRIFVTHGHVDHYGNAERIRRISGATVYVHPADRWKVVGEASWGSRAPRYRDFLERSGAPAEAVETMIAFAEASDSLALRLREPVEDLREGMRLSFARCEGMVLSMPGHTPGLVCALLRGAGISVLVSDDHLLEKVSPNPILEIFEDGTRFRALPHYLRNLERVERLELDWVLPGHGPLFSNHRQVIESLRAFYDRRQEKLLGLLPPEGATAFELMRAFFPQAGPLEIFLMMGEILGNLDLLEASGRIRSAAEKGRILYRAA